MRVTRETEKELVLEDSSIWLFVVLGLSSLAIFGASLAVGNKSILLPRRILAGGSMGVSSQQYLRL